MIPVLHVITSDEIIARPNFATQAEAVITALGPNGAFHLRTQSLNTQPYVALVQRLAGAAHASGTLLVINDRLDIALTTDTPAIQLGRQSLTDREARSTTPIRFIGTSVHSVATAKSALFSDWITVGHLFETPTHPGDQAGGYPLLEQVLETTQTPVIAIGGITEDHVAPILRLGAAGVAVVSGIWSKNNPAVATIRYLSRLWPQVSPKGQSPSR